MATERIILFYSFAPVPDPDTLRLWQLALCEKLNLKGRIIVSPHGINGTLGGDVWDLKQYIKTTKKFPGFRKTDFKWSDGKRDDFPKLSVKSRKEIVTFHAEDELKVDERGVVDGGIHLKPTQVHTLVEEKKKEGEEVVFFDGRNAFEAQIGKFKNAIVPEVETTREFLDEIESGKYDHLKDKPVVTYCTGGIRCEILSTLMKNRGFQEVYQIEGGIVRYGETFGDEGLWEGSLYVFDKRMHLEFTPDAKVLGRCINCGSPTHEMDNSGPHDDKLVPLCSSCREPGVNKRRPANSIV